MSYPPGLHIVWILRLLPTLPHRYWTNKSKSDILLDQYNARAPHTKAYLQNAYYSVTHNFSPILWVPVNIQCLSMALNMWCDQAKLSLKSVKFNVHFCCTHHLQSYLFQQTPLKLVNWLQRNRPIKDNKNQKKTRNYLLRYIIGCIKTSKVFLTLQKD